MLTAPCLSRETCLLRPRDRPGSHVFARLGWLPVAGSSEWVGEFWLRRTVGGVSEVGASESTVIEGIRVREWSGDEFVRLRRG